MSTCHNLCSPDVVQSNTENTARLAGTQGAGEHERLSGRLGAAAAASRLRGFLCYQLDLSLSEPHASTLPGYRHHQHLGSKLQPLNSIQCCRAD